MNTARLQSEDRPPALRRDFASHLLGLSGLMTLASIASAACGGARIEHDQSLQFWLTVRFDPKMGVARMQFVKEWRPW